MVDKHILNQLIVHPNFKKTLDFLKTEKIKLPYPSNQEPNFAGYPFPNSGKLSTIEEKDSYYLNAKNGQSIAKTNKNILAYDESRLQYGALEGSGYFTSHSLIMHGDNDYIPSNYLTFYFYTRSKNLSSRYEFLKDIPSNEDKKNQEEESSGSEIEYKRDYAKDRFNLICETTPPNSILFIDGPLIGGQISSQTVELNNYLLKNNIIPIFFVKNSNSNLVTDAIQSLKGIYNSDMHWSFNKLKKGYRTNFFKYVDENNNKFAKIFCYLKPLEVSPQRIEFHTSVLEKFGISEINNIMDLIYYLILVQGSMSNPQIRSIAIAEKYARETIKLYNINYLLNTSGFIPTMNQVRFG